MADTSRCAREGCGKRKFTAAHDPANPFREHDFVAAAVHGEAETPRDELLRVPQTPTTGINAMAGKWKPNVSDKEFYERTQPLDSGPHEEPEPNEALTYQPPLTERYHCGCIRVAKWTRCETHTGLAHDEEPPTAAAGEREAWREECTPQALGDRCIHRRTPSPSPTGTDR